MRWTSALCWLSCLGRVVVMLVGTSSSRSLWMKSRCRCVCGIEPKLRPSLRQPICWSPSLRFGFNSYCDHLQGERSGFLFIRVSDQKRIIPSPDPTHTRRTTGHASWRTSKNRSIFIFSISSRTRRKSSPTNSSSHRALAISPTPNSRWRG